MGSIGKFAEEFWNVEVGDFGGWYIVTQRMKEANKITGNCIELLKQVAAAMETFGRALLKTAKNSPLPDMEHGNMKASMQTALESVEEWGQDTIDAATAITTQVTHLSQHLTQAKQTRKNMEEEAKQQQQQVRDGMRRVQQAQRYVQNKMREMVDAETHKLAMDSKHDAKPRDIEKATLAKNRAVENTSDAEAQHKDAVIYHNKMVDAWCSFAGPAFSFFQEKEEARLALLRESLWSFANICSLLAIHIDQYQDNIRSKLLHVDVDQELSTWVAFHRTLQTPPIPLVYTPLSLSTPTTPSLTPSASARSTLTEMSTSSNSSPGSSPVPLRKARALYQFSARSESEVSLAEGQVITVMDKSSAEWSLVRTSNGVLGFVPAQFISSTPTKTK